MKKSTFTRFFAAFALLTFLAVPMGMWGQTTVTYTQSSTTAVSVTDGTAPTGSSASFTTTYSNMNQLTAGNSMTLTLSGYQGKKITGITLSMKSNASKGAGTLSVTAGSTTIASISPAANFNTSSWYGAWSTTYVGVNIAMSNTNYTIQANEDVVITISATVNSLYCESFTFTYENSTAPVLDPCDLTLIDAPVELEFDLYNNSNAQTISYTTSSTGEVTVADSDYITTVVDQTNKTITVTPVAVTNGTQNITVNQVADENYAAGSKTFTINITDSAPYVQPTTIEANLNDSFFGTNYGGSAAGITDANPVSGTLDNVIITYAGSGNHYINATQIRFYPNNKLQFDAPSGYEITQIVFTSDGTWTATISANNGTYTSNTKTWTGSAASVLFTGSGSGRCDMSKATITLASQGDAVATTTTINVPQDFNTDIYQGTTAGTLTATVSAEGTPISGATVTWSSSNTGVATIDANGEVTLVAVGTTTITANYAGVEDEYRPSSATYELTVTDSNAPGTQNNPYTVAQARAAIDAGTGTQDVYARGIVSEIVTPWGQNGYQNITFNLVDEEGAEVFLQAFRCVGTEASNVAVGDIAVVHGNLTKYSSTYEFAQGCELVSLTHPTVAVEAPTFSPEAGTFDEAQNVTITCATEGATIYYTLNGTQPTNQSTQYVNAIEISTTTTIKAIAYVDTESSTVATATYHFCSAEDPYTVTEALAFNEYPANGIYVHGIVSTAPTQNPTNNGELTYYISVDGDATNQLEVYKGKGLNQVAFTAQDDIQVGDIVTVYGNVVIYNNTKEFAQGNYLVSFERPVQEYTLTIGNPEHITITAGYGTDGVLHNGDEEDIVSGTEITLALTYDEGYMLDELIVLDGNGDPVALTPSQEADVWTFTMPNSNVTVNATAVEEPVVTTSTYTLATSIESGKQYIIVGWADGTPYAMGAQRENNRAGVVITVDVNTATVSSEAGVCEFVVASLGEENYYSIYDEVTPGYLYAASSTANNLKTEAQLDENNNGKWKITVNSETGLASVVADESSNRNVMQFNNSNKIFSCYASASQHPVFLYVKDETPATVTYPLEIAGYGTSAGGYYLIASPVTVNPADVEGNEDSQGMTEGNFDLYYFDQSQDYEWINWKQQGDNYHFDLVPGKGYLYAHDTDVALTLTGTPYTGDGVIELDYDADASFAGWNLVGNPLATAATMTTNSGSEKPFYVMNDEGTDVITAENPIVARMQGVFVVATGANQTVTFSESEPQPLDPGKVVMNISNARRNVIDRAIVRFGEGEQLPKFMLNPNNTKIYIPQYESDYAMVRSDNDAEMPVNFKAATNGTYTISVNAENVDMDYMHLIDNMTGADIDLLVTPSYTFEANTTDAANRFTLVYGILTGVNEHNENNFAYYNGNNWTITSNGDATLQVVDLKGRVLSSEQVNGSTNVNINQAAGVYMLRLVNGDNVKTQKVVVR